jgi:hypothetical protein
MVFITITSTMVDVVKISREPTLTGSPIGGYIGLTIRIILTVMFLGGVYPLLK